MMKCLLLPVTVTTFNQLTRTTNNVEVISKFLRKKNNKWKKKEKRRSLWAGKETNKKRDDNEDGEAQKM